MNPARVEEGCGDRGPAFDLLVEPLERVDAAHLPATGPNERRVRAQSGLDGGELIGDLGEPECCALPSRIPPRHTLDDHSPLDYRCSNISGMAQRRRIRSLERMVQQHGR